jgi:hypothetical protein
MSIRKSVPESGKVGPVVHLATKYGQVAKQWAEPRDPRTPLQMTRRGSWAFVSRKWQDLTPEQQTAWDVMSADRAVMAFLGRDTPLPGFDLYVHVNIGRLAIGLSLLEVPCPLPSFSPNPTAELVATLTGGIFELKLHALGPLVEHTLLLAASPRSCGVRCVQHFPFLGFLPPPVDGWCILTDLYVRRYGVPAPRRAIFIQTRQHLNGWTDLPKQVSTRIITV